MEKQEEKTDNKLEEKTAKNRLKHAEYKMFKVVAKSKSTLLGGAIATSKQCVKRGLKQLNVFERNGSESEIVLPARWFRAMLRNGARLIDEGDNMIQYAYTFDVVLKNPKIHIESIQSNPLVMGRHQGKGAINYEALKECRIDVDFVLPVKHLGVTKAKEWIRKSFMLEGTGAYRKGYGRFNVESIKVEAF